MKYLGIGICMIAMWGGAAVAAYLTHTPEIMMMPVIPSMLFAVHMGD